MRFRTLTRAPLGAALAGAAVLALAAPPTPAQEVATHPVSTVAPGCGQPLPFYPTFPSPTAPSPTAPQTSSPLGPMAQGLSAADINLGGGLSAAGGGRTVALNGGGSVDDAVPFTHVRLRFDAAYDDNRPDRAEFFYGKCGCFTNGNAGALFDPHAPGPLRPETSVDYQEVSTYFEYAVGTRFSAFVEVPVRLINPEQNSDHTGIGDMNVGAKFAMISGDDTVLTFQGRVYIPTGDAAEGLGTDHTSLEPAILLYQRLCDRVALQAEFRDWIPIGGTDFEGNIVRYGLALNWLALDRPGFRVMPVTEVVGWTVLSGKELTVAGPKDATDETIVNAKFGARLGFGDLEDRGLLSGSDLYIGYGRALTGTVWYKDIFRVEYRMRF
ncbi:MAG TPA: transporter [Gemmataceae bacterium]|nr:transporter [Gemmataceae bacterium]